MLVWWRQVGVGSVDLAVRRSSEKWIWHRGVALADLPRLLPWARAENARRSEIYARPARGSSWPVVFLDDLLPAVALGLAKRHPALCVHTSPEGGCQLWLGCAELLDEAGRGRLQRALAARLAGDPGSVSGEHLGRLAGFRNWKRQGPWVNVLAANLRGEPVAAGSEPERQLHLPTPMSSPTASRRALTGRDTSESGREWGWVCGALEAGLDPDFVRRRLVERARPRRGPDAERYARRTVEKALRRHEA